MTSPTPESRAVKVDAAEYDDLRRRAAEAVRPLIIERLGVPADASVETIMNALDSALTGSTPKPPAGAVLVDADRLRDLERDAEVGHDRQNRDLVAWAIRTGRTTPASRATWLTNLAADPVGTAATLRGLKKNTIPIAPRGHSEADDEVRDLYRDVFGNT